MPEASSRRVVGRSKRRGAFGLRLNAIPVKEGWTSKHMTARGDRIRNECCSPCIAIMPVWQEHDEGEERAQSRRRKRLTRTRRRCTVVSCGPSRVHVQGMTCAVSTCVRRLHNAVNEGVLPGGGRVWMAACEDALRSAAGKAYLEGEGDEAMLVSGLVMIAFADAIREILDTRLASEGEGGGFYHVGDGGMVAAGGGCDDFLGASGAVRRAADLVKHVLGSDCLIINGSMP